VASGATVNYWLVIENTGDTLLTSTVVSDSQIGFSTNIGDLAIGARLEIAVPWVASGYQMNTATASARDPNNDLLQELSSAELAGGQADLTSVQVNWSLNFATGLFDGVWVIRNNGDAAVRSDYDYWIALPVTSEWWLWNKTGVLPNGYYYLDCTSQVQQLLKAVGNRDDHWDPGEQIEISGIQIYHRRRVNPSSYVSAADAFISGQLFHSYDANRNFTVEDAERGNALNAWRTGSIEDRVLLDAVRLSRGAAYLWDQSVKTWEVLGVE
jgi:hypothetical protein